MADYFTNFSFNVPFANTEQRDYALNLFLHMNAIRQGEDLPPDFPANLIETCEDCTFELDPGSTPHQLWCHSDNGGIDAACAFVQHLLARFQPDGCVSFEWSHDCSQPRTDAYGGGAGYITAKEIKTLSTAEWLRQQAEPQLATSAP
jgi:hypothetical protein